MRSILMQGCSARGVLRVCTVQPALLLSDLACVMAVLTKLAEPLRLLHAALAAPEVHELKLEQDTIEGTHTRETPGCLLIPCHTSACDPL